MQSKYLVPIITLLGITLFSCINQNKKSNQQLDLTDKSKEFKLPDSLSSRRITFVMALRDKVAENHWDTFNDKPVEGPFIYFNKDKSEIFFPSNRILNRIDSIKSFSDEYILTDRTDTIPYHFELMISFDPNDSTKLYYDHPIQQFLSVEETELFIPSVNSTEMWSTMVIHEMFHHFQYNNPSFKSYAKSQIGTLPFDIRHLIKLCNEDDDFLAMIQNENKLLLQAISEKETAVRDSLIYRYLNSRTKRIDQYSKDRPFLERVENYYIIQEGSARYIEFQSMKVLKDFSNKGDSILIKDDPKFNHFKEFKDLDLNHDEFNYLIYAGPTTYHYTLGFNLMRLLDGIGVDYKETLINYPEKALHDYLEAYLRE